MRGLINSEEMVIGFRISDSNMIVQHHEIKTGQNDMNSNER